MVILDQASGSYLSIDRRWAAGLGGLVQDWPLASDGVPRPRMLQSLIDRRLITQDPLRGKSAASAAIALPRHWVREGESRGCPPITARDLHGFGSAPAWSGIHAGRGGPAAVGPPGSGIRLAATDRLQEDR
ncbi:hypothetical protein G6F66_014530 [Rhizopus arrhizus]|nr:hypothetical protein G6F66_014530 [Rhizopus arrhizus]